MVMGLVLELVYQLRICDRSNNLAKISALRKGLLAILVLVHRRIQGKNHHQRRRDLGDGLVNQTPRHIDLINPQGFPQAPAAHITS